MARTADREMRRRLVDAARSIIEADGVDGLSMRRLAAKVGVAPTAIYWHIGSREDLLNAVLEAMIADIPPVVARGRSPRARVASLASAVHAQILATVPTTRLAQYLGRTGELFFPAQIALARELSAVGLRGDDVARAVRAILYVVGGFTLLEDSYERGQSVPGAARELWQDVDDPAIDDQIRSAMSRTQLPAALLDFTLDRLLASILG